MFRSMACPLQCTMPYFQHASFSHCQHHLSMTDSFKLVFTVALKQEIPLEWLQQQIPVCSVAAAQSGFLKSLPPTQQQGVLVLITGVGKEKSLQAAEWIASQLKPMFVVNIGSAGAVDNHHLHHWVAAKHVSSEEALQKNLELSALPFYPEFTVHQQGILRSTHDPYTNADQEKPEYYDFVDMEAYAQAEVFHANNITFSSVKYITDLCSKSSLENYQQALEGMRESSKKLLSFINKKAPMSVSVVIPVHNRPDWIVDTIRSVIAQSYAVMEIIVVDDGSDIPLVSSIEEFADTITLLRLPENTGVSAARNAGAALAKGEWLAFLDSDDHWASKKLAKQIEYLQQQPYLNALQCEEIWIRNGVRVNAHKHHQKKEGWIWQHCLQRCLITPSAILLKKSVYDELNGFDEAMLACEDYDLWLRLSRRFPVGLNLYQGVIKHGGHDDQLSQRHSAMDRFRVYALIKALRNEQEQTYQQALLDTLREKITILILGARKRSLEKEVQAYEALLNHIKAFYNRADHTELSLENIQWLLASSV